MKEINDEQIISMIQNASTLERGFSVLMDKYQEPIYWVARRMINDHDDANDVTQNIFIKVFRNIGAFKGESKLYTWLYRIAVNETITFINQKNKKSTVGIEDSSIMDHHSDNHFDGDATQKLLKDAIDTLPEKQKIVFNLRYYDEMPYEEMSSVLDTSVGALKASFHHAVKKIESFVTNNQ